MVDKTRPNLTSSDTSKSARRTKKAKRLFHPLPFLQKVNRAEMKRVIPYNIRRFCFEGFPIAISQQNKVSEKKKQANSLKSFIRKTKPSCSFPWADFSVLLVKY